MHRRSWVSLNQPPSLSTVRPSYPGIRGRILIPNPVPLPKLPAYPYQSMYSLQYAHPSDRAESEPWTYLVQPKRRAGTTCKVLIGRHRIQQVDVQGSFHSLSPGAKLPFISIGIGCLSCALLHLQPPSLCRGCLPVLARFGTFPIELKARASLRHCSR